MSAIALVFWIDGRPATIADVEPMVDAMAARGPDGKHLWIDGSVAFGLGALHGTPEAPHTHYPVISHNDRFAILWDGRVDNRESLLNDLRAKGIALSTDAPDPQIVVEAFVVWGEEITRKVEGDFAFAVWDRLYKQLFCARDVVGARPFYWARTRECFAIASEDRPLTLLPGVSSRANFARVLQTQNGWFSAYRWERSWLTGVQILMPSHGLRVGRSGCQLPERYFEWQPEAPLNFRSSGEAVEQFAHLVERATLNRTRGSSSIGVIASGGIDSATVALAAARIANSRPVLQFSGLRDDPGDCMESQAILSLSHVLSTKLFPLMLPSVTGTCNKEDVERFNAFKHPVDQSIALIGMMCLAASRSGQRVLLHGVSGDCVQYAPSDYLWFYMREHGIRKTATELVACQQHHTYNFGASTGSLIVRSLYEAFAPAALRAAWRFLRWNRAVVMPEAMPRARRATITKLLPRRQLLHQMKIDALARRSPRMFNDHATALFPEGLLRGLEGYERVAGRYGVELRDPLSDRAVLEFCLRLPLNFRTDGGWTKVLMRRYASPYLPAHCVWRTDKSHLGHLLPSD